LKGEFEMTIRSQMYEWELFGNGAFVAGEFPTAGREVSIFTGGFGNFVNEVCMVRDTEFIVINNIGCTPGVSPQQSIVVANELTKWVPNMMIQVVIETTGYYRDPQNVYSSGVSGMAAPYPMVLTDLPYYDLKPPIYIVSNQTWDVRYTFYNDLHGAFDDGYFTTIPASTNIGRVWVNYTLFNGTDSLIANRLLSLGIPITIDSVEWFRKLLLKSKGLETDTFNFYLQTAQEYRDEDNRVNNLLGLKRYNPNE
tara:strand:- start:1048 stop:1806 length:759 start_codon:yes stop_codon:yes gene_type:complete